METLPDISGLLKSPPPVLLSAVIWVTLQALKQVPRFPSEWLPLLSLAMGAAGYPLLVGLSGPAVVQGFLIGALPTALHQAYLQRAKAAAKGPDDGTPTPPASKGSGENITASVAVLGILLAMSCASPRPVNNTHPASAVNASLQEVSESLKTGSLFAAREAVRLDPAAATTFLNAAKLLDSIPPDGLNGAAVDKALGSARVALATEAALYSAWEQPRSQQERRGAVSAMAEGLRIGSGAGWTTVRVGAVNSTNINNALKVTR